MTDRIVIAGASGFLGQYLVSQFRAEGATVSTIGRSSSDAVWGDTDAIVRLLDGADLVINLAGKSVNCRYTPANRAEILRSRVETTRELNVAVRRCATPPPLWVNSSTATIYRHADDRPMTESSGELGEGFSVDIARAWEKEFFANDLPGTRRVALRMAIVLGDGSALRPLVNLARFGLGGPQLDGRWFAGRRRRQAGTFHEFRTPGGRQKFSWVHIADVLEVIRFVRSRPEIDGAVNVSSPNPSDDRTVMASIRRVLGMPVGLPAFRWMLEAGMFVFRTEPELVLKSRWVLPERLLNVGFQFTQPNLAAALTDILHPTPATHARPQEQRS
ncbi:epimerase [Mycetocola zhadangensis]|uniref:epimerase n=1 Tax=Mycetocola zhadangensis TaxID=1164595 RepID=UPI003A4D8D83